MANDSIIADPEEDFFAGADVDEPVSPPTIHKNADSYDPTLDPGNPRWNPQKYFATQPKVIVVVKRTESDILSDPDGQRQIKQPVSINGYALPNGGIVKGVPTKVPRDFADFLVRIGAAYRYADIPDALS